MPRVAAVGAVVEAVEVALAPRGAAVAAAALVPQVVVAAALVKQVAAELPGRTRR